MECKFSRKPRCSKSSRKISSLVQPAGSIELTLDLVSEDGLTFKPTFRALSLSLTVILTAALQFTAYAYLNRANR